MARDTSIKAEQLPTFTVIGEKPDSLIQNLAEIWRYRPLIGELLMRELRMRYKNRVGGILWSLFPPVLQVFTITFMVKLFMQEVNNYSAYIMGVMFLWQFFQNTVLDSGNSLLQNASLIRKIYFPRAILPLVALLLNLIHFSIAFVFTIGYLFVLGSYPGHLRWHFFMLIPTVLGMGCVALGLGYMTARLNVLYEDIRFLSTTFMGLFFYSIPVLYPVEKVAARPDIYAWYMLNPVATYVVGFQRALLAPLQVKTDGKIIAVDIPWFHLGVAGFASIAILIVGVVLFERTKWTVMERL